MDEDTRFPGREKEVALLLKLFGDVGFTLFSILDYYHLEILFSFIFWN